jgi:hypothetical protein
MSIPAADGHVWKPTSEGVQHQFRFDDHSYGNDGLLRTRCGANAAPILEQAHCPNCLVLSPATDTADELERQATQAFPEASVTEVGEVLRDR